MNFRTTVSPSIQQSQVMFKKYPPSVKALLNAVPPDPLKPVHTLQERRRTLVMPAWATAMCVFYLLPWRRKKERLGFIKLFPVFPAEFHFFLSLSLSLHQFFLLKTFPPTTKKLFPPFPLEWTTAKVVVVLAAAWGSASMGERGCLWRQCLHTSDRKGETLAVAIAVFLPGYFFC